MDPKGDFYLNPNCIMLVPSCFFLGVGSLNTTQMYTGVYNKDYYTDYTGSRDTRSNQTRCHRGVLIVEFGEAELQVSGWKFRASFVGWSEFSGGTVELVRRWIWLWDIFDWLLQDSQVSLLHLLLNPYLLTMRFRCSLACHYHQNLWQQQFLQTALCVAPSQVLLNCRILSNLMNIIVYIYISGQIIATSHDLTPNGGLVREITLF